MYNVKSYSTIEQQIDILKERGCIINSEDNCKFVLENITYYRLSAYFLPFKQNDNTFISNTTFEKVFEIYKFDKELRNVIFAAIEDIEISYRAKFSNFYANTYDCLSYTSSDNFNNSHNSIKFNETFKREITNNKRILFVKHHIDNYDGKFPIWVASELFTFGMLSRFYNDLTTKDKKAIMGHNYKNAISWFRCCTDLRNICAHYGRLYYRIFTAIPSGLNFEKNAERSLWAALLSVKALYPFKDTWNNKITYQIALILKDYEDHINLRHIGFPPDWNIKLYK